MAISKIFGTATNSVAKIIGVTLIGVSKFIGEVVTSIVLPETSSDVYAFDGGTTDYFTTTYDVNTIYNQSAVVYARIVENTLEKAFLGVTSSNTRLWFRYNQGDGGDLEVQLSSGALSSSISRAWVNDELYHQFAYTYDGTDMKLYIDGVQLGTTQTDADFLGWTDSRLLQIGKRGTTVGSEFNGEMRNVQIYDRALTQSELTSLNSDINTLIANKILDYSNLIGSKTFATWVEEVGANNATNVGGVGVLNEDSIPFYDLISYYAFNDTFDNSVGADDAEPASTTPANEPTLTATGLMGGGAYFDGSNSGAGFNGLIVPNDFATFGDGVTETGFSFTMVLTSETASLNTAFFSKRGGGGGNSGEYQVFYYNGYLYFSVLNPFPNEDRVYVRAAYTLPANEYHHYGFTYDGSGLSAGLKVYIDGLEIPVTTYYDVGTHVAMSNSTLDLNIGGFDWTTGYQPLGEIEGFGIWDDELSEVEMFSVAHKQLNGTHLIPTEELMRQDNAISPYVEQNALGSIGGSGSTRTVAGLGLADTETAQDGDYSIKVSQTVDAGYGRVDFNFPITDSEFYNVKFWAKRGSQSTNPYIGSWTNLTGHTELDILTTTWTEYNFVTKATLTGTGTAKAIAGADGSLANDNIYVDNLSITSLGGIGEIFPQTGASGKFIEVDADSPWVGNNNIVSVAGVGKADTATAHSGDYCIRNITEATGNARMGYVFTVTSGVTYTASWWVKGAVGDETWDWRFENAIASGTDEDGTPSTASTAWTQQTATWTSTWTGSAEFKIWNNGAIDDIIYVDSVTIKIT